MFNPLIRYFSSASVVAAGLFFLFSRPSFQAWDSSGWQEPPFGVVRISKRTRWLIISLNISGWMVFIGVLPLSTLWGGLMPFQDRQWWIGWWVATTLIMVSRCGNLTRVGGYDGCEDWWNTRWFFVLLKRGLRSSSGSWSTSPFHPQCHSDPGHARLTWLSR